MNYEPIAEALQNIQYLPPSEAEAVDTDNIERSTIVMINHIGNVYIGHRGIDPELKKKLDAWGTPAIMRYDAPPTRGIILRDEHDINILFAIRCDNSDVSDISRLIGIVYHDTLKEFGVECEAVGNDFIMNGCYKICGIVSYIVPTGLVYGFSTAFTDHLPDIIEIGLEYDEHKIPHYLTQDKDAILTRFFERLRGGLTDA